MYLRFALKNTLKKTILCSYISLPAFSISIHPIRYIHESKFLVHAYKNVNQSNVLKINEIHRYFCCLLAFKNKDRFPRLSNIVSTRNSNDLQVTFQRLSVTQRSVTFVVPKYFNELPPDVKNVNSIPIFKKTLKRYLLEEYNI